MVKRIPVTAVQLWITQLNCFLDIEYRSIQSDTKSICEVGRPKFTPEIAS